jgi:ATP-dependent protease HslVU (ClpYQ) ATPase subunit
MTNYSEAAKLLGVEEAAVKAVASVESQGFIFFLDILM